MSAQGQPPVMPPPMSRLAHRARLMGYGDPLVEVGDFGGVNAVRVTLKDSDHFRDVEAVCAIGHGYQHGNGRVIHLAPDEAEYLATRSALAEALVLAMHPDARRDRNGKDA